VREFAYGAAGFILAAVIFGIGFDFGANYDHAQVIYQMLAAASMR
jgi:hypothetical protein